MGKTTSIIWAIEVRSVTLFNLLEYLCRILDDTAYPSLGDHLTESSLDGMENTVYICT
jgi:hypothetical protein